MLDIPVAMLPLSGGVAVPIVLSGILRFTEGVPFSSSSPRHVPLI
jgi:hypothetical protein